MSDHELADDLFGDSGDEAAGPSAQPEASSSRSRTPEDESKPKSEVKEEAEVKDEEEGDDLFGDDDDDGDGDKPERGARSPSTPRTPDDEPNPLEYGEEDDEEAGVAENWATLGIPTWNHLEPTDGKVWHLKLPSYVNIESAPYDPDHYRQTMRLREEEEANDPLSAKRKMIDVRNTIRWKWGSGIEGEPDRKTNARMVRWSDGSVSLQLGSDFFDVAPSFGTTLARPTDPQPKLPAQTEAPSTSRDFVCVAVPDQGVIVTETALAGSLTLLPTGLTSKTHMELVKQVGQQHVKVSRMKILHDIGDQAKVNELLRVAANDGEPAKRVSKPRKPGAGGGGGRVGGRKKSGRGGRYDSGSEGYESDEPRRASGLGSSRRLERDAAGEYDEDDGFVVADDDDDDDGAEDDEDEDTDEAEYGKKRGSTKRKKSKSGRRKREESLDEMEAAERRIEEKERERKRAKTKSSSSGGASASKIKSRDYVDTDEDEDAEGEEEDMVMDEDSA